MTSLRGYSNTTNDSQPYENAFLENSKSSSPKTLHNKLPTSYPANVPQRPSSRDEPGAFGKQPTQSIAPFLARHIPAQYAPQGEHSDIPHLGADISNTKYCYRHRPDLKCRRQANEPTMDQLQNELAALPQSDQAGISHVWSLFSAAPSKHRNLMLQGILAQCCFPQLSFIAASIRELIKIDFLTTLPAEIGLRIFCYLDHTSLCKAAQVSQRWRTLADDDVVWHKICEQHIDRKCTKCGVGLPMLDRKRLRTEKRHIQLRASGHNCLDNIERRMVGEVVPESRPLAEQDAGNSLSIREPAKGTKRPMEEGSLSLSVSSPKRLCASSGTEKRDDSCSPPRLKPWKDVYRDRFRIGANWKHGRFTMKTFKGHSNGVMCLQFDDTILASGSYDSTIKLWNIETGEEIRTLTGHELGVRCLQFDDTKLASGSLDGKVKVWDLQSGKCLCTLPGHTGGVIGLHLTGTLLASSSADETIRVWNFQDRSAVTLRGHTDWVNAVRIDPTSRTLFSASDDSTIRLWDLDTKRVIRTFRDHSAGVQQVVLLPREFECDEIDRGGCWNEKDGDEASLSYPEDSRDEDGAKSRPLPPRYMLTGGLDATIRLWDVHRGVCLQTFFGHLEGIWALAADTLRAVSGANDGMVKIWDPCTGKCERTFTSHTGPVTCVGLSDRRMCTGGEDHDIKLYSFCS